MYDVLVRIPADSDDRVEVNGKSMSVNRCLLIFSGLASGALGVGFSVNSSMNVATFSCPNSKVALFLIGSLLELGVKSILRNANKTFISSDVLQLQTGSGLMN